MAGFNLSYGQSVLGHVLPKDRPKKVLLLVLPITFAVVGLAITCVALHAPFASSRSKVKQHLFQNDDITVACISHTRFPEVCISSLSTTPHVQRVQSMAWKELEISKLATREAQVEVGRLHSSVSTVNLEINTTESTIAVKASLTVCEEVLDRSYEHLGIALRDLSNLGGRISRAKINNIRTWLSAVVSFHATCAGQLSHLSDNSSISPLKVQGEYVEKLISNALAFGTSLYTTAGIRYSVTDSSNWPFTLFRRGAAREQTIASDNSSDAIPAWFSEKDMYLLNGSSPGADAVVAKDGSGKYKSVQAAVHAAPTQNTHRFIIYIKKGIYDEQVIIPPTATNLMFVGDGTGITIITGNRNVQQKHVTTFSSATVAVNGNGFLARDISFRNTAGAKNGQAVALRVSADRAAFYKCSIEGYQDTLYTHSLRQFYRECSIYGTVDYIFGDSAAVFQRCKILARVPLLGQANTITAQGRSDPNSNTGLSFQNCIVDGISELHNSLSQYKTFLGRPWRAYSRTVFLNCNESSVVDPAGWLAWNVGLKSVFYGEYQCSGPGARASHRVPWSTQITSATVAKQFTPANFIDGGEWLPNTRFPYDAPEL